MPDIKTAAKESDWPQRLQVPAQPHSASRVRAFVRKKADAAGFSDDDIAEIEVAVGEAVTNAILYGQPRGGGGSTSGSSETEEDAIRVEVGLEAACFYIEVRDPGPGFDPDTVAEAGPENGDALGGRGLYLMRALMHHVAMSRDEQGMRVRMERTVPGAS